MAHGIHRCLNFLISFARPASLYREEHVSTHTYLTVYTIRELPLLPNNIASETFLHKSGVLTGYLSLGCRPGGDWANTSHWAKRFTSFFSNRQ